MNDDAHESRIPHIQDCQETRYAFWLNYDINLFKKSLDWHFIIIPDYIMRHIYIYIYIYIIHIHIHDIINP